MFESILGDGNAGRLPLDNSPTNVTLLARGCQYSENDGLDRTLLFTDEHERQEDRDGTP
jgi:hypothetical protein